MNGGGSPRGYTIVEVMIFLAVTGALLVMALTVFSGQQGRTQFSAGSREMEARMQDLINDVSTGFYARTGDFKCVQAAGQPQFSAAPNAQGTNEDCIFVGRIPHFDVAGAGEQYNVYTAAGVRQAGSGAAKHEVQGFDEARARAVLAPVDLTQTERLPPGLQFGTMYYRQDATYQQIDALGFFSSFSKYQNSSLQPGTMSVNVVPLTGGGAGGGSTQATIAAAIQGLEASAAPANMNPNGGVVMCFNSTGSNQYAKLSIGDWSGRLTTNLEIKGGTCPANVANT
jgi:type II secretory pathway pseudopilin PulG